MEVKYEYRVEKKIIKAADLNNGFFQQLQNRRKIRPATVKAILERLNDGKHFGTPLHVNKIERNAYIIDGNHRWEAIKRFLAEDPNNTVEVTLFIYDNLIGDEEKDVYTTVNKANKQNTNDVVKQYEDEINILKFFANGWQEGGTTLKQFPVDVTIYPQPNTVSFYRLVGAYLACKAQNWHGGYMGTPWEFVDDAKALRLQDIKEMSAFMTDFMQAFGGVVKNNNWLRGTALTAVMKLWIDNRANIPPDRMVRLFEKRLYNDAKAVDLGKAGGSGATITAHSIFKTLLNKSQKKFVFR